MPYSQTLTKKCSKCFLLKTIDCFSKAKTGICGVRGDCKKCQSISAINYNLLNKTKQKEYRASHQHDRRSYINNRLKTDSIFKLSINIKNLIRISLKRNSFDKKSKSIAILGCSISEFKQYLELQFLSWMTWNNHGLYNGELDYGWDIDHIIPTSSATCEEDIIRLNHYTNLQPLCSKTNRDIKKNKHVNIL